MLDDLFFADNLRTAQDAALRPPPVPKQAAGFSAWRTTKALPTGVVAGGSQSGAFFSDVLGAFGQVLDATGTASAQGMFATQTEPERKQSEQQAQQIRAAGPEFSSPAGDELRGFARFLAPDPETTHTAERMVFDVARVATKAVGYSVAGGGPLTGAVLTAGDEGMTTADDLKQQGVDLGTRTAVGAVVGGVTALGVGLPMAGGTLAQTAGLVALGGPVSFMAQQQAVRRILESQDYSKLAEQYDPFDPVGLAVATLIPAGFGAWGLRSARARAATEAKAAAARPAGEPRPAGEDPAIREASQEQVDAARVMLDMEQRRSTNPLGDDMRTADAHETALVKAADQMARGERVAVDDAAPRITPEARDANFRAWFGDSKVVDEAGAPMRVFHGTAGSFDSFDPRMAGSAIDAGKLGQGFYFTQDARWASAYAENSARKGGAPNVAPVFLSIKTPLVIDGPGALWPKLEAISKEWGINEAPAMGEGSAPNPQWSKQFAAAAQARGFDGVALKAIKGQTEFVVFKPEQVKSAIGNSGRFDPNSTSLTDSPIGDFTQRIAAAGRAIEAELPKPPTPKEHPRAAEPTAPKPEATQPATAAPAAATRAEPAAGPADPARPAGTAPKAGLVDDAAAVRVEQVKAQMPDLMVQLDGMDAPVRVDELLATVKAEADDLLADSELMRVAAECALSVGS